MKKALAIIAILLTYTGISYGTHREILDAGNITIGTLQNTRLPDNGISGSKLASKIVMSSHIADGVTINMAVGVILSSHIADNAISGQDIGSKVVMSSHIADNGISGGNLGSNIIVSSHILDTTIIGADIFDGTISADDLGTGSVLSDEISNNTIASVDILELTITNADIEDNTIRGVKFAAGILVSSHIADNAISGGNLGAGILVSTHIADNSIRGGKFAAGIIVSTHIADNTISGTKLGSEIVTSSHIVTHTIKSINLFGNIILSTHIANGEVSGNDILDGTITTDDIFDGTIAGADIQDGGITRDDIYDIGANVVSSTHIVNNSIAKIDLAGGTSAYASYDELKLFLATATSGGGASPQQFTTHTITLSGGGDVSLATGSFIPQSIAWLNDPVSTWTITSAQGFVLIPSTLPVQFSVMYSTGGTNPTAVYKPIQNSSFTISPETSISTPQALGGVTSILPNEVLSLWTTFSASSAAAASGRWGVNIRAWKQP